MSSRNLFHYGKGNALNYGFIVVTDVINMECSYIMFYVAELSASEHLFAISAI